MVRTMLQTAAGIRAHTICAVCAMRMITLGCKLHSAANGAYYAADCTWHKGTYHLCSVRNAHDHTRLQTAQCMNGAYYAADCTWHKGTYHLCSVRNAHDHTRLQTAQCMNGAYYAADCSWHKGTYNTCMCAVHMITLGCKLHRA